LKVGLGRVGPGQNAYFNYMIISMPIYLSVFILDVNFASYNIVW